jgi:hypothetical protein
MTSHDYRKKIVERNKELFSGKKISISPDSFLLQIQLAFEAGQDSIRKAVDDGIPGFLQVFPRK